jgi:UDP-GlcNAc:undecaprenyl-phosphate/decaprenyl-phosphate GlcNAc-1-phosphate transferase
MVGAGVAACLVTLAATPVVLGCMRRLAAVDTVTERSLHHVPTPRGGGVAVGLGLFAGVSVVVLSSGRASAPDLLPMTLGVALFGLVGLAEDVGGDIGGIAPLRRLGLQALAALAVTAVTVVSVALVTAAPPTPMVLGAAVVGPVWIAGFVNAFNFMDGVNGISAAQALIAGGAYAILGATHDIPALTAGGAVVAGAALGFAPFNFPRARIFLGDVGSYGFGAALAVLALHAVLSGAPVEATVAPLLLYLVDTATTLVRRVRAGERWYLPHRTHTYQRLASAGWSHTRVTEVVCALILGCAALGLVTADGAAPVRVAADLGICLLLAGYLAAPSLLAPPRPRRPVAGGGPRLPATARIPAQRQPGAGVPGRSTPR